MKNFLKYRTHDVAFTARMPAGIPGDVSRKEGAAVEARPYDATNPPTAYGVPLVLDATTHNVRKIISGDNSLGQPGQPFVYGILVRPFPISNYNTTDGLGSSAPNLNFPADVLRRGYINVLLSGTAAAVAGGQAYTRLGNVSTGKTIGDIEAAGDYTGITASATTGTGTSTAGTLSFTDATPAGVYKVVLTATGATAAFNVVLSDGAITGTGNIGTQYTDINGLSFKITAGGTPTSGDYLTITVVQNTYPIPNCFFTGAADASGNVEIAFKM